MNRSFGWFAIVRLGLVQAGLGAVVVMTTSTLNRVMVVELALPALLPGILVAMHCLVQVARRRMGYGSDMGRRRTPWIVGGMLVLAFGGALAAVATAWMGTDRLAGIALAVVAFVLIGMGVSAAGTSLLVLLAKRVDAPRRATAATIAWLMMILGFAVTPGLAGKLLDPYSPARLIAVTAGVSVLAVLLTLIATWRLEGAASPEPDARAAVAAEVARKPAFREALAQVWAEPVARRFTLFVFISMLAYSAQDLILEPFVGNVFDGTRMRLWSAAQAVAFGMRGLVGTAASDLARWLIGTPAHAYAAVFAFEALLFVAAAALAARLGRAAAPARATSVRALDRAPALQAR